MTIEEARYVLAEFDDTLNRFESRCLINKGHARQLRDRLTNALTVVVMEEEELECQCDKKRSASA
jgi:hypothetical protein